MHIQRTKVKMDTRIALDGTELDEKFRSLLVRKLNGRWKMESRQKLNDRTNPIFHEITVQSIKSKGVYRLTMKREHVLGVWKTEFGTEEWKSRWVRRWKAAFDEKIRTITKNQPNKTHNNLLVSYFSVLLLHVSQIRMYPIFVHIARALILSVSFSGSIWLSAFFLSRYANAILLYIYIQIFFCSVLFSTRFFLRSQKDEEGKKNECISPCFTRHLLYSIYIRMNRTHGLRE